MIVAWLMYDCGPTLCVVTFHPHLEGEVEWRTNISWYLQGEVCFDFTARGVGVPLRRKEGDTLNHVQWHGAAW